VYYVSETLDGAKKILYRNGEGRYAVVMASRKLKHYFQAHKIIIPSSVPLNNIFKNLEAICQIGKWATKINDFIIESCHACWLGQRRGAPEPWVLSALGSSLALGSVRR
jgi:hypothetical protein